MALLVPLAISIVAIVLLQYMNINNFVTHEVKDALKGQVEIIYGPMVDKYTLYKIGVIKDFNLAFTEARKIVKTTKFGRGKKGYFWLVDAKNDKVLAYPLEQYENKPISNFKASNGNRVFSDLIRRTKAGETSGFFEYNGVDAHNPNKNVNKVGFYTYFKEWDWILGTELSLSSIQTKTMKVVSQFVVYFLICTVIIFILVTVIVNRAAIGPLDDSIAKLSTSAQKIENAATTLSASSESLSSTTTQQASSVGETSASLEEITGMVANNVSNADETVELSTTMKADSEKGSESMGLLQSSMEQILDSNEKIENLVKLIGNIGEKTKVMDEIVFQTKLLSFNASVEAERAGEHGRGFAVVAQEVGNLAQLSGSAAKEIATIVTDSIKDADLITTDNKSKVEQGNRYVQQTADILGNIVEQAECISEKSKLVQTASKEQSTGITQINTAMAEIETGIQSSSNAAENAATSVEDLRGQVIALNTIMNDLKKVMG